MSNYTADGLENYAREYLEDPRVSVLAAIQMVRNQEKISEQLNDLLAVQNHILNRLHDIFNNQR